MTEVSTEEIRKDFFRKLQEEVNMAYEKRALVACIEGKDMPLEQLEEYKKQYEEMKDKPDSEVFDFGTYVKEDCEVTVDNPQDYRDLLRMAVLKHSKDPYMVSNNVKTHYSHEEEHFKPLLERQIKCVFGVHFFEDKKTGRRNFTPFTALEGKCSIGLYRVALYRPSNHSSGDQALLGKQ